MLLQNCWGLPSLRVNGGHQLESIHKSTEACKEIPEFLHYIKLHSEFVDEMYDEAGKLPLLSMLLVDSLHHYQKKSCKEFVVLPQARLMKGQEYKTDYALCIAQKDPVSVYLHVYFI